MTPSPEGLQAGNKDSYHVIVVGGGISGCAIACELVEQGVHEVLLFEREALASGATGICPGGIRQQFSSEPDCRLARYSYQYWNQINQLLEPEHPFDFEKSGYLFLAFSEDRLQTFRRHVELQNRLLVPSQILSADEIHRLLPELNLEGVRGGSFCGEDGFIEDCDGVTRAFAEKAVRGGARVVFQEVDAIQSPASSHRNWEVRAAGETYSTRHLVLAAGVDTLPLTAPLGLSLPIRAERRRLAFTEPYAENVMLPLVIAPELEFAGKQLTYGVFYFGWLAERPEDDDLVFMEKGLSGGARLLPLLEDISVRRILKGTYDNSPDSRPVLGAVPKREGLHLAVGFSGHGFMIAPAVAHILACGITGRECQLPMEPFSIERFGQAFEPEGLVI